jgi:hypothetical protein
MMLTTIELGGGFFEINPFIIGDDFLRGGYDQVGGTGKMSYVCIAHYKGR